ncbi:Cytotoxic necrotizing factor 1 [Yersinia pseudotuberculosis]|nr:Cytotoxic necrotizing factor 1 [Yersinia pseudotuberculosis]
MLPSEYLYFLRDCDFSNLYNKALSDYWAENYEKFSTLLQNYYISSAYYLYKDSAISKDEYELSIDAIFNKKIKYCVITFMFMGIIHLICLLL